MPTDFDFDENLNETVSQEPVAEPEPPVVTSRAPKKGWDDELEYKMSKAQLYWSLLNAPLFEEDSDLSLEVEEEVFGFLRSKLAELMGSGDGGSGKRKPRSQPRPVGRVRQTKADIQTSKRTQRPPTPPSSTALSEEITQTVVAEDGSTKTKVYRKFLDNESKKAYYLGYDKVDDSLVGDGNKYELTVNSSGGRYFRVISQQTLPPTVNSLVQTKRQLEAQSAAHATATIQALQSNLNPLLGRIIAQSTKEEE